MMTPIASTIRKKSMHQYSERPKKEGRADGRILTSKSHANTEAKRLGVRGGRIQLRDGNLIQCTRKAEQCTEEIQEQ